MATVGVWVVNTAAGSVEDLTKSDFSVTLDGKAVAVQNVEIERFGALTRRPPSSFPDDAARTSSGVNAGRTIVFAFDDLSATATEGRQLVASLDRTIGMFGQSDLVGLVTTSGLGPTVSPTTDRSAIRFALKSKLLFGRRMEGPVLVTFREALDINQEVRGAAAAVARRECAISAAGCNGVSQAARAALVEGRNLEEQQLDALADLAQAMGRLPEPRVLILLTSGIPFGMDGRPSKKMGAVRELFSRAQVRLYTLTEVPDLVGVSTAGDRARALLANSQFTYSGAQSVASAVGGSAMRVIGQGDRFFERIEREVSSYYRLYVEVPAATRRDHALTIRVRSLRPSVEVSAPSGLVIPAAPVKAEPTNDALRRQLARGGSAFGVPFSVGTMTRMAGGTSHQIAFELLLPGTVAAPVNVLFALMDEAGRVIASGQKTLAAPTMNEYRLSSGFTTAAGEFQLRVSVADGSGNIGASASRVVAKTIASGSVSTSGLFTTWQDRDGARHLMATGHLPAAAEAVEPTVEFYVPAGTEPHLRVEFSIRHDDTGRVVYSTNVDAQTTGDRYVSQGHWISGSAEPGTYTLMARLFDGTRELGTYELPMFVGGG